MAGTWDSDDSSQRYPTRPPYRLNQFPSNFAHAIGRQIIYLLATKEKPSLQGSEWEQIFARAIKGDWQPSNVGLDDVVKGVCSWGAKSVISSRPFAQRTVRLISGRNNPEFSFGEIDKDDDGIGAQVLGIWNARVDEVRAKFGHVRTVVLLKGADWTEFAVFEIDAVGYPPDLYEWKRNQRGNLEGFDKAAKSHRFTWQRHGSQFTILEPIPEKD